ncbi:MAG: LytTR family DNA-binding domain-containing protein [Flavobacteriales bacterium]|nr:LytTR family DNA-binding domain-containing protein [Flavobacteriales bacterium]
MPYRIKTIIVDDEPPAIDTLCFLLKKYCREMEVVATATDIQDAIEAIQEHQPDVLFVDIQLKSSSDTSWLNQFDHLNFEVVIVSAFQERMLESFKLWKPYFLPKPVDINEFLYVYERILDEKKVSKGKNTSGVYLVKSRSGNFEISLPEVLKMEAEGSYARVHLISQQQHFISKNLRLLLSEMNDERFFRVSRSLVVNLHHITSLDESQHIITLADGTKVELAQRRKSHFMKVFRAFKQ